MSKSGIWELCPKCNGQGIVSRPPYISGDQQIWTTINSQFICDVCNGSKIISSLTGLPTNK